MVITIHPPGSWLDEMVCSKCGNVASLADWGLWVVRLNLFGEKATWMCPDCQKDGEK